MKNPFKTYWNWLLNKNYPSCLAEELAIKTPYTVEELQPMINIIKVYSGFDKNSKEAEQTHIVKEKSYKCVVAAMEGMFDPSRVAVTLFEGNEFISKIAEDGK